MYLVRPSYLIKFLFPKAVWRSDRGTKILYLTLDDGPVPEATPFVLDLLKQKNIKATFFCVGENIKKYPEIFQRIIKDGHAIGNHTFNHVNGWNTDTAAYIENVEKCEHIIRDNNYSGIREQPLFRPPYGKLRRSQSRWLRTKYSIIMWDVLSGDFDRNTAPEKCLQNVLTNLRNGSVILFHDSIKAKPNMEYALPRFIDHALAQGYTFSLL